VTAFALLLPTSLPRCFVVWAVCAGVAFMFGVLLAVIDRMGPQRRG